MHPSAPAHLLENIWRASEVFSNPTCRQVAASLITRLSIAAAGLFSLDFFEVAIIAGTLNANETDSCSAGTLGRQGRRWGWICQRGSGRRRKSRPAIASCACKLRSFINTRLPALILVFPYIFCGSACLPIRSSAWAMIAMKIRSMHTRRSLRSS